MTFAREILLSRLVWTGLASAGLLAPAFAQTAPDSKAMQLTVRPSGYDKEQNEALERQQKLLKRLERSNHMVRSICVNCGDHWKHQIYAPFDPLASLGASGRTKNESVE